MFVTVLSPNTSGWVAKFENIGIIDCINNGRSSHDITHWFVFRVSILAVAILVYLETEVTIFGKEDDAEHESHDARRLCVIG